MKHTEQNPANTQLNADPDANGLYVSTDGFGPESVRIMILNNFLTVTRAFKKSGREREAQDFAEFARELSREIHGGKD